MPQENVELALNELAANTRQLRTSTGSSLSELAKRAGLTKSMVKHIEHCRANPALSDVYRLRECTRLQSFGSRLGRVAFRRAHASESRLALLRSCSDRRERNLSDLSPGSPPVCLVMSLAERAGIGRTTLLYIESGRTQLLLRFAGPARNSAQPVDH